MSTKKKTLEQIIQQHTKAIQQHIEAIQQDAAELYNLHERLKINMKTSPETALNYAKTTQHFYNTHEQSIQRKTKAIQQHIETMQQKYNDLAEENHKLYYMLYSTIIDNKKLSSRYNHLAVDLKQLSLPALEKEFIEYIIKTVNSCEWKPTKEDMEAVHKEIQTWLEGINNCKE